MKTLFCLILTLFLLPGCKRNYRAEKLLWRANQNYHKILQEQRGSLSEATINKIIGYYQQVVAKYPATLSAGYAYMVMGKLYWRSGKLKQAIKQYRMVTNNFSRNISLFTEASFLLARLYELTDQWDKAERQLYSLSQLYPFSAKGLKAPLYIYYHYLKEGKIEKAQQAYKNAEAHYNKLTKRGTNEMRSLAYFYLFQIKYQHNKIDSALEILEKIMELNEKNKNQFYVQAMYFKAEVLLATKRNIDKARKIYQEINRKFPQSRWASFASARLIVLNRQLLNESQN